MNQRVKRLATCGPSLLLLAFFSIELIASATRLECGLVSLLGEERTRAQSKRSSTLVVDLFRTNCARCHGADGRADTPLGHTYNAPDFTGAEWWRKHSELRSGTLTTRRISLVPSGGASILTSRAQDGWSRS